MKMNVTNWNNNLFCYCSFLYARFPILFYLINKKQYYICLTSNVNYLLKNYCYYNKKNPFKKIIL